VPGPSFWGGRVDRIVSLIAVSRARGSPWPGDHMLFPVHRRLLGGALLRQLLVVLALRRGCSWA
jgi:hypothetical protein